MGWVRNKLVKVSGTSWCRCSSVLRGNRKNFPWKSWEIWHISSCFPLFPPVPPLNLAFPSQQKLLFRNEKDIGYQQRTTSVHAVEPLFFSDEKSTTVEKMRSQPQLRNDKYIMMQYTNWINSALWWPIAINPKK